MDVLSQAEINERLTGVADWQLENNSLARSFSFSDFREAMSFVNSVADMAEKSGHHPDIDIRYNKVRLVLSSHDAGGITVKDFSLAAEIGDSL